MILHMPCTAHIIKNPRRKRRRKTETRTRTGRGDTNTITKIKRGNEMSLKMQKTLKVT